MTEFRGQDLSDARFVECDLGGATVRACNVDGLDIDDPFLLNPRRQPDGPTVLVNGVDVLPFVEAELNRRFSGRELRGARDADGLRAAWAAVEAAWEAAIERASGLPAGMVERSVGGEFSFSETLRHVVMAIDTWLGRAIEGRDDYHPIGVPNAEYETDGYDPSVFSEKNPAFERVLEVFRGHQARVRTFIDDATDAQLDEPRTHAWGDVQVTVGRCLGTILNEEWEHLRYARRDLNVFAAA